jgi:hypothetical protein
MKLCTTRKGAGVRENCGCVDAAKKCRFCGAILCDRECLKYHERCCNPVRACASCGKKEDLSTRLKLCGGCKKVYYCGGSCQKEHWKSHKSECGKIKTHFRFGSTPNEATNRLGSRCKHPMPKNLAQVVWDRWT